MSDTKREGPRLRSLVSSEGFTTRPELRGDYGMVSSTHWLASAAGMAVLERGGNAFDAAAAAGFVLQVVEPHLNGIGGEVVIGYFDAAEQQTSILCGQGPAPAAATPEHFAQLGIEVMPGNGVLPACVPGAFDAWMRLIAEHGTLPLDDILSYAIGYAERGYPVVPRISSTIAEVQQVLTEEWTTSLPIYLPGGFVTRPGDRLRNLDLAATLRRLIESAPLGSSRDQAIQAARDAFYRGFVAERITEFLETTEVWDTTGRHHRALLSGDDLAAFVAPVEATISRDYKGVRIHKAGPWSQGPVFLQQLALLEKFDIEAMDPHSAEFIHVVIESAKLAFADREAWYGDPEFVDVPLDVLLSQTYADERHSLIGDRASTVMRPGTAAGREPRLPDLSVLDRIDARGPGLGEPTVLSQAADVGGDTCQVDVIDRDGNMVAATPSGGWFQSSPTVPGLGFSLGTRGQMFWLEPGLASSIAPSKRPRTTLSPTIVLRDDEPFLAFGTPGGDMQDQWTLAMFLNHLEFGQNLQEAIDAPMYHSISFPGSFYPRDYAPGVMVCESRLPEPTVDELRSLGHDVLVEGPWSLGRMCAVGYDAHRGMMKAAANPRGMQGYAVGR